MIYFRVKAKYCNDKISESDRALLEPSAKPGDVRAAKKSSKRNVLELRLHHGDVIIMNGRPIQRLLEHAVTPEGFRVAATARNITALPTKSHRVGNQKASIEAQSHGSGQGVIATQTEVKGVSPVVTSLEMVQAVEPRMDAHLPQVAQDCTGSLRHPLPEEMNQPPANPRSFPPKDVVMQATGWAVPLDQPQHTSTSHGAPPPVPANLAAIEPAMQPPTPPAHNQAFVGPVDMIRFPPQFSPYGIPPHPYYHTSPPGAYPPQYYGFPPGYKQYGTPYANGAYPNGM